MPLMVSRWISKCADKPIAAIWSLISLWTESLMLFCISRAQRMRSFFCAASMIKALTDPHDFAPPRPP